MNNLTEAQRIERISRELDRRLPVAYPEMLYESMRYSLLAEGKRIRPMILLAVCKMLSGGDEAALPFACALECIHAYSLIHDDLPALDDDDFRRGKPSNHRQFDEATAILAGDSLLNFAFEIMSAEVLRNCRRETAAAMSIIAARAGTRGMIGGQAVDIASENKNINTGTLLYIYKCKTAALFSAAFSAGGTLASASIETVDRLSEIGDKLGIAFQYQDDVLDVTQTTQTLGKPVGSDEKNGKNTSVRLFGLETARKEANRMFAEALELLSQMKPECADLDEFSFLYDYLKRISVRTR